MGNLFIKKNHPFLPFIFLTKHKRYDINLNKYLWKYTYKRSYDRKKEKISYFKPYRSKTYVKNIKKLKSITPSKLYYRQMHFGFFKKYPRTCHGLLESCILLNRYEKYLYIGRLVIYKKHLILNFYIDTFISIIYLGIMNPILIKDHFRDTMINWFDARNDDLNRIITDIILSLCCHDTDSLRLVKYITLYSNKEKFASAFVKIYLKN